MPKETYFAGSSIPIVLTVTDAGSPSNPTSATITIVAPDGTVLESGTTMSVSTNQCSFTLAASKTTQLGQYAITCTVLMPSGSTVVWKLTKKVT